MEVFVVGLGGSQEPTHSYQRGTWICPLLEYIELTYKGENTLAKALKIL